MPSPLIKLAQYGNTYEILRFEKPLLATPVNVFSPVPRFFKRRVKSTGTFKMMQNIQRTKRNMRQRISVLTETMGPPAFASFTVRPKVKGDTSTQVHDIGEALEMWRLFTRRMKKAYPDVAFVRVPERHESGAIHFHAAMFGLPLNQPCVMKKMGRRLVEACPRHRYCERKSRALRKVWGHGHVDLSEARKPDSIGGYLAKYLTKGEPDWTLFGHHVVAANDVFYKKINSARQAGWYWSMSSFKESGNLAHALEVMESRGAQLQLVRYFQTRWLGQCRYEIYRVGGG